MKVLIIDDDPQVVDALSVSVRFHWNDVAVEAAHNGGDGLDLFLSHDPDIVLLDVGLPDRDGFDILQEIRRFSDVPVLLLTARSTETDQVRGLELGADDYVVKPFSHLALLARIKAVLRRTRTAASPVDIKASFDAGELGIDFESREVRLAGAPVALTPAEYRLLYHLVRNRGRLVTRESLIERVWGEDRDASPNNLKALVSRLRAKLGQDGRPTPAIKNERGLGYRFVTPSGASDGQAVTRGSESA
jgi:two-component system KDP operon response regulator KdpE